MPAIRVINLSSSYHRREILVASAGFPRLARCQVSRALLMRVTFLTSFLGMLCAGAGFFVRCKSMTSHGNHHHHLYPFTTPFMLPVDNKAHHYTASQPNRTTIPYRLGITSYNNNNNDEQPSTQDQQHRQKKTRPGKNSADVQPQIPYRMGLSSYSNDILYNRKNNTFHMELKRQLYRNRGEAEGYWTSRRRRRVNPNISSEGTLPPVFQPVGQDRDQSIRSSLGASIHSTWKTRSRSNLVRRPNVLGSLLEYNNDDDDIDDGSGAVSAHFSPEEDAPTEVVEPAKNASTTGVMHAIAVMDDQFNKTMTTLMINLTDSLNLLNFSTMDDHFNKTMTSLMANWTDSLGQLNFSSFHFPRFQYPLVVLPFTGTTDNASTMDGASPNAKGLSYQVPVILYPKFTPVLLNSSTTSGLTTTPSTSSGVTTTSTLPPAFGSVKKKPNDPVTLQELEQILQLYNLPSLSSLLLHNQSGHNVHRVPFLSDLQPRSPTGWPLPIPQPPVTTFGQSKAATVPSQSSALSTRQQSSGGVAFPQPSVLSFDNLKWGTTVASGTLGLLLGISLVPNLWLIGLILGSIYGQKVVSTYQMQISYDTEADNNTATRPRRYPLSSPLLYLGKFLAQRALTTYDAGKAIFFMYKTGQLSYQYYKTYAALDDRFAIQSKIDAWNAFFVEGKIAFDKWERENEVGRKVLAGLRTVWLVDERQKKEWQARSGSARSRYRLVQMMFDLFFWAKQLVLSMYKSLMTGRGQRELKEFVAGVLRMDSAQSSRFYGRMTAAFGGIIAVYMTGALFAVAPVALALLAITAGFVWPTWLDELADRLRQFWEETRARGRGQYESTTSLSESVNPFWWGLANKENKAGYRGRRVGRRASQLDKGRYHYYTRLNGKKRYYRAGQSWFTSASANRRKRKAFSEGWPWPSEKRKGDQDRSWFSFFNKP